jgi:hypothetical protein
VENLVHIEPMFVAKTRRYSERVLSTADHQSSSSVTLKQVDIFYCFREGGTQAEGA